MITDYNPYKGITLFLTTSIIDSILRTKGILTLIILFLIILWASKGRLK